MMKGDILLQMISLGIELDSGSSYCVTEKYSLSMADEFLLTDLANWDDYLEEMIGISEASVLCYVRFDSQSIGDNFICLN